MWLVSLVSLVRWPIRLYPMLQGDERRSSTCQANVVNQVDHQQAAHKGKSKKQAFEERAERLV